MELGRHCGFSLWIAAHAGRLTQVHGGPRRGAGSMARIARQAPGQGATALPVGQLRGPGQLLVLASDRVDREDLLRVPRAHQDASPVRRPGLDQAGVLAARDPGADVAGLRRPVSRKDGEPPLAAVVALPRPAVDEDPAAVGRVERPGLLHQRVVRRHDGPVVRAVRVHEVQPEVGLERPRVELDRVVRDRPAVRRPGGPGVRVADPERRLLDRQVEGPQARCRLLGPCRGRCARPGSCPGAGSCRAAPGRHEISRTEMPPRSTRPDRRVVDRGDVEDREPADLVDDGDRAAVRRPRPEAAANDRVGQDLAEAGAVGVGNVVVGLAVRPPRRSAGSACRPASSTASRPCPASAISTRPGAVSESRTYTSPFDV